MGANPSLAALSQLVMSLRQQLQGNDPSSQYRKLITAGGTVAGWFALSNNGITINLAGLTDPITSQAQGIVVEDQASQSYGSLGPFQLIFVNDGFATGAASVDLGQDSGDGYLTLRKLPSISGAYVTLDGAGTLTIFAGTGSKLTAVLNSTHLQMSQPGVTGDVVTVSDSQITLTDGTYTTTIVPTEITTGDLILQNPTAHGVLLAEGANKLNSTGPGTAGQVLTSNGAGADPTWDNLPTTSGYTGIVGLAALTAMGTAGSITFNNGIATGVVAPT